MHHLQFYGRLGPRRRAFATIAAVIGLLVVGAAQPRLASAEMAAYAPGIPATLPWRGAANGVVTIVEVSDFQCPFCARVGPTIQQILKAYPKDVRIVWVNQPLPFHTEAKAAAMAAMAAHKQGKFWEMHDKLFANQRQLNDANYVTWATEIGLDMTQFSADRDSAELASRIEREQAAANASGANGTPSFFINGKLFQGAQPLANFKTAIDAALADAKAAAARQTGMEQMKRAAAKSAGLAGVRVVEYFFEGRLPEAAVDTAEPDDEGMESDEGPAKPPMDSYEVWKVPVDPQRDAIKGGDTALITLVGFSDFECPFCARSSSTLSALEQAYGDKLRLVFKHHPLPFHNNAHGAAAAAIAAGRQGKFWAFHDKCFTNWQELTDKNFVKWARELGLDMGKFEAARKDPATDRQISADMEMAGSVGVRGTPSYFINGRKVVGAQPLSVFRAVIDEELTKAEAAGKRGQALYEQIIAKGKLFIELSDEVNHFDLTGLPYKGKADAPITIVTFADFQCPYSGRVATPLHAFYAANKDRVKVVFVHFPLSSHNEARPAAVLAQLAFELGGVTTFWSVHDALYAAQRELGEATYKTIARRHGIDWAMVKAAIAAGKYDALFSRAAEMGEAAGLEGTPTIFINGRKFEPPSGYTTESLTRAVQRLEH